MYLSELYGRIGQILREDGDMPIVRHKLLKIDGCSNINDFVDFRSDCFGVFKDYQYLEEEELVNKHFIIVIP